MAREFQTGAYRDGEEGKNDYEGFLSPLVIKGFGDYMTKHRLQSNGEWRDSDNWQKGITKDSYMKSMWRHFLDVWLEYDGYKSRDGLDEALYGLLFNVMGFIHETEKENCTVELTEKGKEYLKCKHNHVIVNYGEDKITKCVDCGEIVEMITPNTDWVGSFNKMMDGIRVIK
jgi:hypothetical protein